MNLVLASLLGLALGLGGVLRVPGPLSSRIASFAIDARLDADAGEIRGTARLTWRNTGTAAVRSLPLHLYMNAFKNERSRFLAARVPWEPTPPALARRWGWCRIDAATVALAGEAAVSGAVTPWGADESLAALTLPRPLGPGEVAEVRLEFTTRLPAIVARAGVSGGFFAVTQWFPKPGVHRCDRDGCAFAAAAYEPDAEFFADFGAYDVALDVPADLVVGATGVLVAEERHGGRRTLRFRAEDVHDFAWVGDARFVERSEAMDDGSGLPPVEVRLLSYRTLLSHAPRHLRAVREGLAELGRRLGPYPYRTLTVVEVPPGAEDAGGMEYPTIFLTDDRPAPAAMLWPELVTAHELAHQWFQGMVASDEADEPWLDEGLAELATGWVLGRLSGPPAPALVYRLAGHQLGFVDLERNLLGDAGSDAIVRPASAFRDHRAYAQLAYRKASLLMATLEARLGPEAFGRALRGYVERHRFGHPRGGDLVAAFAEAPAELRRLLDEALHRAGTLDYAVTAVRSAPARAPAGVFEGDAARPPAPVGVHHSEIDVERLGDQRLPVTVRARFCDGTFADHALPIDGADASRWQRVAFDDARALCAAQLHPAGDTPLDTRRWNDGLRARPDARPRRALTDAIRLLTALALSWWAR